MNNSIQPKGFHAVPSDWVSEPETFESPDGKTQLFGILHHAKDWKSPRVLIVLHGLAEHSGRYLHFPHYVRSAVEAVFTVDHRGHGRSEGLRGHVNEFDDYAKDAAHAILHLEKKIKERFGRAEVHLLGHSMGGLIALRTLFLYPSLPLQSASVSAALLKIAAKVPPIKRFAAQVLCHVWGSLQLSADLDVSHLSHDPEVGKAYLVDRLVHQKMTPKLFSALQFAMPEVFKKETGFEYPLQMLVPLQDKIVDSEIQLKFFGNLKIRDKRLKTYPTLRHEPFNEIGKETVFEDLVSWIKSHSSS